MCVCVCVCGVVSSVVVVVVVVVVVGWSSHESPLPLTQLLVLETPCFHNAVY